VTTTETAAPLATAPVERRPGPSVPVAEAAVDPHPGAEGPGRGTRRRLDHIDAMRPVKQAGVVSTHTLLAFAAAGSGVATGAALMLLHVTREAFLFVSACMLTYSYRQLLVVDLGNYARRRFSSIVVPYLCWTLIYFLFLLRTDSGSWTSILGHLGYLTVTGYYQLYYLVVLAEFYLLFPLLLMVVRRTAGHHGLLLAVSGAVQVLFLSLMHWEILPTWLQGFWATREITSYQLYLVLGMVIAVHLDEVHSWLLSHVRLVVVFTLASAALAEGWYFLSADNVVSWLGSSTDPFQPVVIPFNLGAIACIYLVGVALVDQRRSRRTRAVVQSGSDNAYGVYLAQMIFIVALGWFGWNRLDGFVPWPIVCLVTVALVFLACVALTALLARTPLAKPLTGRTRVPWPAAIHRRSGTPPGGVDALAGEDNPLEPDPAG
jgi:peptidoglycan/LPS O-acetylase OafA/YrhL